MAKEVPIVYEAGALSEGSPGPCPPSVGDLARGAAILELRAYAPVLKPGGQSVTDSFNIPKKMRSE